MSRLRSPLRFPGGKSKVAELITSYFPAGITEMVSPFFGGGGVELLAAQMGIKVYGYDGFKPLAAFWENLLDPDNAWDLIRSIQNFYPLSADGFRIMQKYFGNDYTFSSAVKFFVLNRASFSGTTMSGGCTLTPSVGKNARFTQSSIDRLREFADFPKDMLSVSYSLWPDTLKAHPEKAAYIDPPYLITHNLYGIRGDMHKRFDHKGLALALKNRNSPWLLSYNDCEQIREWYKEFEIIPLQWQNSMGGNNEHGKTKKQTELLIKNY